MKPELEKTLDVRKRNRLLDRVGTVMPPVFLLGARIRVLLGYFHTDDPNHSIRDHAHKWYEISVVEKGSIEYTIDGSGCVRPSNDEILIIPARRSHRWRVFSSPVNITSFQAEIDPTENSGAALCETFDRMIDDSGSTFALTHPLRELIDSISKEAEFSLSQSLSAAKLRCYLRLFLFSLFEEVLGSRIEAIEKSYGHGFGADEDQLEIVEAIQAYVKARLDRPLHLKQIAEHFHLSTRHLNRLFKARYGCSIGVFMREAKIEAACGELRSTKRSIKEIAYSLGYKDAGYFGQQFAQIRLMTPTEYRDHHSAEDRR